MRFPKVTRILSVLAIAVVLTSLLDCTAAAENAFAPYESYEFNYYGESTAAPIGYMVSRVIDSRELGLETPLDSPREIVRAKNGNFYILDSNNNRIIEIDEDLKLVAAHENFIDTDGKKLTFSSAKALAVGDDGKFYIGDTEGYRILITDAQGHLEKVIGRPDEALKDVDSPFRVARLLLDDDGRLFALADSINMGAFIFGSDGKFISFFGSNPVTRTSEVLLNEIRKRFLTRKQMLGLQQAAPTTFTSFAFNKEGFVYTVTADKASIAKAGMVRLLNYEGRNVLGNIAFGDIESDRATLENAKNTEFCDIAEDSDGFINLLDKGRGKVFQYTEAGDLVSVFGVYASQTGGFVNPVSLETHKNNVLVLDAGKNQIICFAPTGYGKDIRAAFLTIGTTDTSLLEESCKRILEQNSNSVIPYYGLGMMYDSQGEYALAMKEFVKSQGCKAEYSNAFRQERQIYIRNNFGWIALIAVAAIAAMTILLRFFNRKMSTELEGGVYTRAETKYFFPLYTALHPIDGFSQFKTRGNASVLLSVCIVIAWFLISTLQFFKTGYCFNMNRVQDYSLILTVFKTVFLFVLFVLANWSVCTLLDGKGTFKDIIATTAYSLVPMLICMLINVLLSNALVLDEQAFISMISFIGILWSGFELLLGMYSIHQYSFGKTVFSLFLTLLGMAIIIFLIILFYSLLQQTYSFGESVNIELSLR